FSKFPDGAVPPGWVNAQGKFLVATLKGADGKPNKVLRKDNAKANPLFYRGNAYFGLPSMKDYTIQADVMGTRIVVKGKVVSDEKKEPGEKGKDQEGAGKGQEKESAGNGKGKEDGEGAEGKEYMPDIGIVANRYTLMLAGNHQKLRIVSWSALPRVDETLS